MIRPHRGSRAMSTIGAKVQWIPTARASRAATAWPRSMVSGSQEAAIAIGTGRMVRSPWMTSKPINSGMPSRLPSTASRCRRLISAGSVRNNNEPATPSAQLRLHHLGLLVGVEIQHLLRTLGQPEIEVLRQLSRLLRRCHLRQQIIDPRLDRHPVLHFPAFQWVPGATTTSSHAHGRRSTIRPRARQTDLATGAAHVAKDGGQRERHDDFHRPQHLGKGDQLAPVAVVARLGNRRDRHRQVCAAGQAARECAAVHPWFEKALSKAVAGGSKSWERM